MDESMTEPLAVGELDALAAEMEQLDVSSTLSGGTKDAAPSLSPPEIVTLFAKDLDTLKASLPNVKPESVRTLVRIAQSLFYSWKPEHVNPNLPASLSNLADFLQGYRAAVRASGLSDDEITDFGFSDMVRSLDVAFAEFLLSPRAVNVKRELFPLSRKFKHVWISETKYHSGRAKTIRSRREVASKLKLDSGSDASLSNQLEALIKPLMPQEAEIALKTSVMGELSSIIRSIAPNARCDVFGSSASGLGFATSDIDIALHPSDFEAMNIDQVKASISPDSLASDAGFREREGNLESSEEWLGKLKPEGLLVLNVGQAIRASGLFEQVETVSTARVPVVKALHKASQIQCDVAVGNMLAVHNTALLRTYSEQNARIKSFIMCIKLWAKKRGVGDASCGFLSSYAWTLLALFYLQRCPKKLGGSALPNLQVCEPGAGTPVQEEIIEGFKVRYVAGSPSDDALASVTNMNSLGTLLRGFFAFYAGHGFNLVTDRVDFGPQTVLKKPKEVVPWRFCIIDPFELTHDLGTTLSGRRAQTIINEEIWRAYQLVNGSNDVTSTMKDLFIEAPRVEMVARPCLLCGGSGHNARKCTIFTTLPVESRCFSCGSKAHLARDCPMRAEEKAAIRRGEMDKRREKATCYRCGQTGHISANCPSVDSTKSTPVSKVKPVLDLTKLATENVSFSAPVATSVKKGGKGSSKTVGSVEQSEAHSDMVSGAKIPKPVALTSKKGKHSNGTVVGELILPNVDAPKPSKKVKPTPTPRIAAMDVALAAAAAVIGSDDDPKQSVAAGKTEKKQASGKTGTGAKGENVQVSQSKTSLIPKGTDPPSQRESLQQVKGPKGKPSKAPQVNQGNADIQAATQVSLADAHQTQSQKAKGKKEGTKSIDTQNGDKSGGAIKKPLRKDKKAPVAPGEQSEQGPPTFRQGEGKKFNSVLPQAPIDVADSQDDRETPRSEAANVGSSLTHGEKPGRKGPLAPPPQVINSKGNVDLGKKNKKAPKQPKQSDTILEPQGQLQEESTRQAQKAAKGAKLVKEVVATPNGTNPHLARSDAERPLSAKAKKQGKSVEGAGDAAVVLENQVKTQRAPGGTTGTGKPERGAENVPQSRTGGPKGGITKEMRSGAQHNRAARYMDPSFVAELGGDSELGKGMTGDRGGQRHQPQPNGQQPERTRSERGRNPKRDSTLTDASSARMDRRPQREPDQAELSHRQGLRFSSNTVDESNAKWKMSTSINEIPEEGFAGDPFDRKMEPRGQQRGGARGGMRDALLNRSAFTRRDESFGNRRDDGGDFGVLDGHHPGSKFRAPQTLLNPREGKGGIISISNIGEGGGGGQLHPRDEDFPALNPASAAKAKSATSDKTGGFSYAAAVAAPPPPPAQLPSPVSPSQYPLKHQQQIQRETPMQQKEQQTRQHEHVQHSAPPQSAKPSPVEQRSTTHDRHISNVTTMAQQQHQHPGRESADQFAYPTEYRADDRANREYHPVGGHGRGDQYAGQQQGGYNMSIFEASQTFHYSGTQHQHPSQQQQHHAQLHHHPQQSHQAQQHHQPQQHMAQMFSQPSPRLHNEHSPPSQQAQPQVRSMGTSISDAFTFEARAGPLVRQSHQQQQHPGVGGQNEYRKQDFFDSPYEQQALPKVQLPRFDAEHHNPTGSSSTSSFNGPQRIPQGPTNPLPVESSRLMSTFQSNRNASVAEPVKQQQPAVVTASPQKKPINWAEMEEQDEEQARAAALAAQQQQDRLYKGSGNQLYKFEDLQRKSLEQKRQIPAPQSSPTSAPPPPLQHPSAIPTATSGLQPLPKPILPWSESVQSATGNSSGSATGTLPPLAGHERLASAVPMPPRFSLPPMDKL